MPPGTSGQRPRQRILAIHRRPPGGSPYGTEEYHGLRRKDSIKFANCGFFLGQAFGVCRGFVMFDEVWDFRSCGKAFGRRLRSCAKRCEGRARDSRPVDKPRRARAVLNGHPRRRQPLSEHTGPACRGKLRPTDEWWPPPDPRRLAGRSAPATSQPVENSWEALSRSLSERFPRRAWGPESSAPGAPSVPLTQRPSLLGDLRIRSVPGRRL
jgi:hypothetical protein